MIQYTDYVYYEGTNNPVVNAEVSVYIANTTTLANLFTDTGGSTPKNNPVTTDQTGMFTFAAAGGTYDLYFLGVKQFQISLNDAMGIPDPLTVQNLVVTGRGDFAELAVNTTDPMPTLVTKAYINGKVYIKDTNLTYPLPAYPSAAGILMSGLTNQTTTYTCQIFSDVLTQVGAFMSLKNKLNGSLPTTGDILGRFSSGWTQSTGGSYTGVGMIAIATADIVQGVTHDTALYFTTMQGSGTATERMRISTPGNLLIGRTTDTGAKLSITMVTGTSGGIHVTESTVTSGFPTTGVGMPAALLTGAGYNSSTYASELLIDSNPTAPRVMFLKRTAAGLIPQAAGSRLGMLQFGSYDAGSNTTPAGAIIDAYSDDMWTAGVSTPAYVTIKTCPVGSNATVERMRVTSDGLVLIGTTSALTPTAKLQVSGDLYVSGAINAGAISYSNIDTTGNLTFTGTGQFIRGDMSNSTPSNRLTIQTSTTNGSTLFDIAPNGTATASALNVYNSSNKEQSSYLRFLSQTTSNQIVSGITGTATLLPLDLCTSGINLRIHTDGNVSIGSQINNGYKLEVIGNLNVTGSITAGSLSYTSISTSGNLSFTAANGKINIYNSTGFIGTAGDTTVQNGTTNGNTIFNIAPNGTGTSSSIVVNGTSDLANTHYGGISALGTAITFNSAVTGTGSLKPMRFIMGSLGQKLGIYTDGMVGINNPVNDGLYSLQVNGPIKVTGSVGFADPLTRTSTTGAIRAIGNSKATCGFISQMFHDTNFSGGAITLYRSMANGSLVTSGLQLGAVSFGSTDGTAGYTPANITAYAEENFTATTVGCSIRFTVTPLGVTTPVEAMRITPAGILLIGGTTASGTAKLQVTGDITATGSITAGSISYTNVDVSGNLTFTSTGQFIRGDMSSGTLPNRLRFQSSTLNGATWVTAVPNGTNASSGFVANDAADNANSCWASLYVTTATASIAVGTVGTGVLKPLAFVVGTEAMRVHTSRNVSIGGTADNGYKLEVVGTLKCTTLIADTFILPSNPTFDTVTFSNTVSSPSANTLDHYAEGSFVAAINEMTGTPTGTWTYTRIGNVVTMSIPTLIGDVPNLRLTVSNIPAAIRPTVDRAAFVRTANNGFYDLGMVTVSPSGTLTFGLGANNDLYNGGPSSGIGITSFSYTL